MQRFPAGNAWAILLSLSLLVTYTLVHPETSGLSPLFGHAGAQAAEPAKFERDRRAILSMAGNYQVTFDFEETVSFVEGYEVTKRKVTHAEEHIRVIEDRGHFISLQHILVVQTEEGKFANKHWRQDWLYEPETVLVFIGGNAWAKRRVSAETVRGKWAQIVYQVDGSPRYGALAAWTHANGVSQWWPPPEWRPLPRRDATRRSDYHAIDGVNRHAITPSGWVHEQDNSKLILGEEPQILAREIGLNTYERSKDFDADVAEDYWAATKDYWDAVRAEWNRLEKENDSFGLTIQGEPEELYTKLLALARDVKSNEKTITGAAGEARGIIGAYTTTKIGTLQQRLQQR